MKYLIPVMSGLLLAGCATVEDFDANHPLIGSWGIKFRDYKDMSAGHLTVSRDEVGNPEAKLLWCVASPESASEVTVKGTRFSLVHPWGYKVEGKVEGDVIKGTAYKDDKFETDFVGWRNPPVVARFSTNDIILGEPIDLLEDGIGAWEVMNPHAKNGWTFRDENGVTVLSNRLGKKPDGSWAGGGTNLRTKRADFYDFTLDYDVKVFPGSNSGVYLRGRYECQAIDSYGKDLDCHNMGAYYGRVTPSVAAEKPAGEWQHVSVTLFMRHITVVLNGIKIIDNAPVTGITGGAIDANEFTAGPIYLQGDHSDAEYRNVILRPALNSHPPVILQ